MIDHLTLVVSDYARSKAFYLAALQPLGSELIMELTREQIPQLECEICCGIGPGRPEFWLRPASDGKVVPTHIAFRAKDRATVDAFHAACLAAGATDNGGPGLRPHYHEHYYGAFVLDPDGYNIEAVCHEPE